MIQFLSKILFLGVTFFIGLFVIVKVASLVVESRAFKNYNTESNLFLIDDNKHFDYLFLGISHARNFSRFYNHQRVEKTLGKSIINLGRGNALCGTGVLNEYVEYFYKKGNSSVEIIYFVSSPVFYADFLDISSKTFEEEPFKIDFFFQYLQSNNSNKWQQMYYYMASKLKPHWLTMQPKLDTINLTKLERIDPKVVNEGFKKAYLETLHEEIFDHNKINIDRLINLANAHKTKVTLIIPPALFGEWKGHDQVVQFLQQASQQNQQVRYFDFSKVISEAQFYYDHHHLNSKGVDVFTQQFLKPALDN